MHDRQRRDSEIIKEIRLKLPDDIKQAKWVKEEAENSS